MNRLTLAEINMSIELNAYNKGYKNLKDNPYVFGSEKFLFWLIGFNFAKLESRVETLEDDVDSNY